MVGPYPPHQGAGDTQSQQYPTSHQYAPPPVPQPPVAVGGYYPAAPAHHGKRRAAIIAGVLLTICGIVTAVLFSARGETADASAATLDAATAEAALQRYLDAVLSEDIPVISRNILCGLYDGIDDRENDDAVARLTSDAFTQQFSAADVTSVDAMVFASPVSAQVLFTMTVKPARLGEPQERQGVAQLLSYNNEILVCSYVPRSSGDI